MSEHTPGPWYMHDYTELFGGHPIQICVSCDELTELTICYMGRALNADLKEVRGNARLIAAAPEMLESLQDLLTVMEHCDEGQYQNYAGSGAIFDAARDIIDDLKGETG